MISKIGSNMGLGFLKLMLLPLQARKLGCDVTKNVWTRTESIDITISERGMLPCPVTGRWRAQIASFFRCT